MHGTRDDCKKVIGCTDTEFNAMAMRDGDHEYIIDEHRSRKINDKMLAEIRALSSKGVSHTDISRKLNICTHSVSRYANGHNGDIGCNRNKRGRKSSVQYCIYSDGVIIYEGNAADCAKFVGKGKSSIYSSASTGIGIIISLFGNKTSVKISKVGEDWREKLKETKKKKGNTKKQKQRISKEDFCCNNCPHQDEPCNGSCKEFIEMFGEYS